MTTVAIIVAAGKGNRAGGKMPKQWRKIAGKLVADWSIDAFKNHSLVDFVIVVLPPNKKLHRNDVMTCTGGKSRSISVYKVCWLQKVFRLQSSDSRRPRPAVSEKHYGDNFKNDETGPLRLPVSDASGKYQMVK